MFTEKAPSFSGNYYSIAEALNEPRPIRPEGIPILVGGSGEKRTLRLVAKYADACNIFGDVATIRRKLEVLDRHCEEAGRDPREITKTRLGSILVGETTADADRKAATIAQARGLDPSLLRDFMFVGDPDSICEQVSGYLEAGLDGMIFNVPDAQDIEPVRLAGKALSAAFG
jgi:alkanesulfonate monooxygenase SsuD/methylene tetrahydromethanopterin reductase-like flavin-dependent oxidoreductase (luciferase family)